MDIHYNCSHVPHYTGEFQPAQSVRKLLIEPKSKVYRTILEVELFVLCMQLELFVLSLLINFHNVNSATRTENFERWNPTRGYNWKWTEIFAHVSAKSLFQDFVVSPSEKSQIIN